MSTSSSSTCTVDEFSNFITKEWSVKASNALAMNSWCWLPSLSEPMLNCLMDVLATVIPSDVICNQQPHGELHHIYNNDKGKRVEYYLGSKLLHPFFYRMGEQILSLFPGNPEDAPVYTFVSLVRAIKRGNRDQQMHCDSNDHKKTLILAILLNDVTNENGPTQFYEEPLGWNLFNNGSSANGHNKKKRVKLNDDKLVLAYGKKGDAFIYTSKVLHRGTANKSPNHRDILFVSFEPKANLCKNMTVRAAAGLKIVHGPLAASGIDSISSNSDSNCSNNSSISSNPSIRSTRGSVSKDMMQRRDAAIKSRIINGW